MSKHGQKTMSRQDAAQMDGNATSKKYGQEFYEEIGHQGGMSQGKENNPGNVANDKKKAKETGKKGGKN